MKRMRNFGRHLALMVAGLGMAGCASWSASPPIHGNPIVEPWNLPAAESAAPANPTAFTQSLTKDYATLAASLADAEHDWVDADYFARKSMAAGAGQVVPPEQNSNWAIPLEVPMGFRTQLAQARIRLVAALDGGARERAPSIAAHAQVSYDCWNERMEDNWQTGQDGPCRREFLAAMSELEGAKAPPAPPAAAPEAPTSEYRVYFEFDRAELTGEARQIVLQIATQVRNNPSLRVVLVGKADRAGSDSYNMALSKRRADVVKNELARASVPASRIDEHWVGEREPPVPTPPGVREPRNRVVEITLQ